MSYTTLVHGEYIDLPKLTELMSKNPAEITGLDKMGLGSIEVGSTADFTLVSTDAKYRLEREDLRGKSHNTPFIGMTYQEHRSGTHSSAGGRSSHTDTKTTVSRRSIHIMERNCQNVV